MYHAVAGVATGIGTNGRLMDRPRNSGNVLPVYLRHPVFNDVPVIFWKGSDIKSSPPGGPLNASKVEKWCKIGVYSAQRISLHHTHREMR
jgi:hypothetical protein